MRRIWIGVLLCCVMGVVVAAQADDRIGVAKLNASDGMVGDEFGRFVSISGDVAIVGSPSDSNENGIYAGAAYVFRRDGSEWSLETKLMSSDGIDADHFGSSVCISGHVAIVGAYADDDNGPTSGSAYVFRRVGGNWEEESKLVPSDGERGDRFGWSVGIDGDVAVVGAINDNDNGVDAGSAYAFTRVNSIWGEDAKFVSDGFGSSHRFGESVAVHQGVAIVGSPQEGPIEARNGAAYVLYRVGALWGKVKLLASDGSPSWFGHSAAMSDGRALLGAPLDDVNGASSGSAYLFTGAVCHGRRKRS